MAKLIVREIKLPPDVHEGEACKIAVKTVKGIIGAADIASCSVCKRSVDARGGVKFNYSVLVEAELKEGASLPANVNLLKEERPVFNISGERSEKGIAVIGFGPAGMFSALTLAEHGYSVTVFERGGDVFDRTRDVKRFTSDGILNPESNIQFGAGGAGTFSDGKLVTRINDGICSYVLERFCEFGAPDAILKAAKPHIGTDKLKGIVSAVSDRIISHGGKVLYNSRVDDIYCRGNTPVISCLGTEFAFDAVILATGHSARDTFRQLYQRQFAMEKKSFSVGVRIEHLQEDINRALYGRDYEKYKKYLPNAEYQLSHRCVHNGVERGVYTFCMCPGGEIAAAASEEGGVVTNGMSEFARDGVNANAAVAVSVTEADYGPGMLDGIEFQRKIEQNAYKMGGGNYLAPIETVGHFLKGERNALGRIKPTYPIGYEFSDCSVVLPQFVCDMLKTGLNSFERKLKGFSVSDAVLTYPETRTSSPLRILRDEFGLSLSHRGVYPCGEGAGYAGGITSAAVDGVRCAMKIMERFKPQ